VLILPNLRFLVTNMPFSVHWNPFGAFLPKLSFFGIFERL